MISRSLCVKITPRSYWHSTNSFRATIFGIKKKNRRIKEWKNGRMEEWKNGWQRSKIKQFCHTLIFYNRFQDTVTFKQIYFRLRNNLLNNEDHLIIPILVYLLKSKFSLNIRLFYIYILLLYIYFSSISILHFYIYHFLLYLSFSFISILLFLINTLFFYIYLSFSSISFLLFYFYPSLLYIYHSLLNIYPFLIYILLFYIYPSLLYLTFSSISFCLFYIYMHIKYQRKLSRSNKSSFAIYKSV